MHSLQKRLQSITDQREATLPWAELEAEAARQGCSPADIFFDRAGRPTTDGALDRNPRAPDRGARTRSA